MSMTFYGGFEVSPKRWDFVEMREEDEINVNNRNYVDICRDLGINPDEEGIRVEIDRFISACSSYLQKNIGRKDPELKPSVEEGSGPTMIFCGRNEGYVYEKVHRLSVFARKAKDLGATVIYAA